MSKKYYAVKKGRKPGIYTSWPDTQKQVSNFSGAQFKSFSTKEEALSFIDPAAGRTASAIADEDTVEAYVDGSYSKQLKRYSYGVVLLKNGIVLEKLSNSDNDSRYVDSYQIAGEVFGCLNAIKWAKQNHYKKIQIHYDYLGIEHWATGTWKARKPVSMDYIQLFQKIAADIEVEFLKVKAHTGVKYNELADQLAKEALKEPQQK